jgi:alpha-mannosidase/mannosylglycerate hydrolase
VVENHAGDHRLRVLFPSGAQTDTNLADSPFDVVERFIALRPDNHLYRELEVETRPQQSWTAVFDQERGLAVVGAGLMECAVRDLPERPLALTLFRATRRTVGTNGEPDGQMRGRLEFDYCIVPLRGEPDRAPKELGRVSPPAGPGPAGGLVNKRVEGRFLPGRVPETAGRRS